MNDKDVTVVIKANASQFQSAMKSIGSAIKGIDNPIEAGKKSLNSMAFVAGAVGGVVSNVFSSAMSTISSTITDAVNRVDTLNRFPTVMANLGYSASDAKDQVQRMAKELIGLPTSLDSLTTFVNRVAPVSGSLKHATDTAIAFNNAVLAGGGPTYRQADAIEQFSQMLSKGVPDMMAWRTLQEAMPATLSQVAKGLGDQSGNTQLLYDKLQTGKVSFQQFTDEVIKLNTKGLPGFKSFQDQAKDATGGIATGVQNMKTAITRGIADIINVIGQKNISTTISNIGKAFEDAGKGIAAAIVFVVKYKDIFAPIAVGIGAIVAAMTAWNVITKIVAISQAVLNAVMAANPIGIIVLAIVGLVAGLTYFFTQTELGKQIFGGFMDFMKGVFKAIGDAIGAVVDWVKNNWPLLLTILMGPIGFAIAWIIQNWDLVKAAFAAAWDFIKSVWSNVTGFFAGVWNGIVSVFSAVGSWFGNIFSGAWNGIKAAFAGVTGFFQGIWNSIVGIFGSIGTAIGNGIVGAVKGVINGILSGAEGIVNGFVGAINGVIGTINKIPGVNIGKIGELHLPRLATGGIVDAVNGGRNITVAEGGQNEWVVPESKMASVVRQLQSSANQTPQQQVSYDQKFEINITVQNDGSDFTQAQAENMARRISDALRAQGLGINEMGSLRA